MRPIEGRVGRCSSVLYAGWYMMGEAEGDGDVEMDLRAGDYKWRVVAVERQNGIRRIHRRGWQGFQVQHQRTALPQAAGAMF